MNDEDPFDAMSCDPLWADFTAEERDKVSGFLGRIGLEPGDRVLEPGCGTGRLSELLASSVGPTGRVLACDPAAGMIARALERMLAGQVTFLCERMLDLRDPGGSFDVALCFNVLPHLVPTRQHLAAIRRLLLEGGSLWVCHSASREFINAIHADAGMPDHQVPTLDKLREQMKEAGLRWCGGEDLADRYWAHGIVPPADR